MLSLNQNFCTFAERKLMKGKKMYYEKKRRNRPAATLIKEYCDKKSGKVSEARRELQRRFDYLDWNQQKKILMAHLRSCTSDRKWAYTQLLSLWDDMFIPVVDELWQTYHEERCSWVIVNHFPEDYLKSHMEELSYDRNYFFICRRLGHDEQFIIDTSRLKPLDHLSLLAELGRTIKTETAMDLVFKMAKNECQSPHYFSVTGVWPESRLAKPSPLFLSSLYRAHYYLREQPNTEALDSFQAWCDLVSDDIQHSQEFKSLLLRPISDRNFNLQVYHLLLTFIAKHLPTETKTDLMSEMVKQNEVFEHLVDKLALEEDVTPPPPPHISPRMDLFSEW